MTWWNQPRFRDCDGIICDGSVRAGKTLAITCGFFLWSMTRFENQVFGLCGKTVGALRRNLLLPLPGWLDGLFTVTDNRSENKLTVRLGSRVNTYFLFGGQDEAAASLIQGITLAGVLLDEVVLLPRSFVEQACARCSVAGAKLWFACNPGSPEHWFYKEWLQKKQEKNLLHLHFTMADNPGLDPGVRQRYERLYTGLFYRRFVLGQWCMAEGLVYRFDREKHLTQAPKDGRWFISVDYGTLNPFSAGLWCVTDTAAVRVREFYYDGRAKGALRTDAQYCRDLEELAADKPVEAVYVDPSAASFITALRQRGRFSVRRAKNAVLPGIRRVTELLQSGRLLLCPECENAIREFSLYSWADGPGEVPVKENDHAMDEIRYFCMSGPIREWRIDN